MQTRNEVSDAKEAAITKKPNYLLLCSCWKAGARGSELVYIAELTKMVLDELPGDEYQRCLGRLLGVDEGNIQYPL